MKSKPAMNGITFAVVSVAMVILGGGVLLVVARGRNSSVALPVTTTSTTLAPATLPPATLPPVTIPPVTRPPVYVPTPTTAYIPPPTYPPPRAGQVVTLPISFMRYPPTTTVPLTLPAPTKPAVGVMAATLANNSGGCHAGVCISLASKNGEGPIIVAWDASSSTGQSCAQFEYRVDGVVYAESPKACDGPGIYSTTWAPDAVMGVQLCSEDLVVSETACEYDQASGFPY
jgi:hypothetical protein